MFSGGEATLTEQKYLLCSFESGARPRSNDFYTISVGYSCLCGARVWRRGAIATVAMVETVQKCTRRALFTWSPLQAWSGTKQRCQPSLVREQAPYVPVRARVTAP